MGLPGLLVGLVCLAVLRRQWRRQVAAAPSLSTLLLDVDRLRRDLRTLERAMVQLANDHEHVKRRFSA
jgi:hypothetical protein